MTRRSTTSSSTSHPDPTSTPLRGTTLRSDSTLPMRGRLIFSGRRCEITVLASTDIDAQVEQKLLERKQRREKRQANKKQQQPGQYACLNTILVMSQPWDTDSAMISIDSGNGTSVPPPQSLNGLGGGSALQATISKNKDQGRLNKAGKKRCCSQKGFLVY